MTSPDVVELCNRAYAATSNWGRDASRIRWVMDRSWYDRLRAQAVPAGGEAARAQAHANALISAEAEPPYWCPACPAGPFATSRELTDHVTAMSDPAYREPAEGDQLFGIAIEVRADGGEPHLETAPQ